jgi:hypothetical protein
MGFTGTYTLAEQSYRLWRYIPDPNDPLTYTANDGRVFRMTEEFETDGATSPRFLWSVPGFDPMDWPRAAILHDWLWVQRYKGRLIVSFAGSNRLLREAICSLGWSRRVAWSAWAAVMLFGWHWWIQGERGTEE